MTECVKSLEEQAYGSQIHNQLLLLAQSTWYFLKAAWMILACMSSVFAFLAGLPTLLPAFCFFPAVFFAPNPVYWVHTQRPSKFFNYDRLNTAMHHADCMPYITTIAPCRVTHREHGHHDEMEHECQVGRQRPDRKTRLKEGNPALDKVAICSSTAVVRPQANSARCMRMFGKLRALPLYITSTPYPALVPNQRLCSCSQPTNVKRAKQLPKIYLVPFGKITRVCGVLERRKTLYQQYTNKPRSCLEKVQTNVNLLNSDITAQNKK